MQTLIVVHTDEGATGWGSSFTNDALVLAALQVLEPLLIGENPLEPERVSEKLHANTFWLGRGGSITHTISGIDIALWDIRGKVLGQPIGSLLGGRYRDTFSYASLLMEEPARTGGSFACDPAQGFRAFKIGWGPFGRRNNALDEQIVRARAKRLGMRHCSWWMPELAMLFGRRDISGLCEQQTCWLTTVWNGLRSLYRRTI